MKNISHEKESKYYSMLSIDSTKIKLKKKKEREELYIKIKIPNITL